MPATSNSYPAGELLSSGPGQFSVSESQKHGLCKGSVESPDGLATTLSAGKVLEHDGGSSNMLAEANKTAQVVTMAFPPFHALIFIFLFFKVTIAQIVKITMLFLGLEWDALIKLGLLFNILL